MKTNSKRKVFGDAVDLLMGDMEEVTMPRGVQMVPVKSIHMTQNRLIAAVKARVTHGR